MSAYLGMPAVPAACPVPGSDPTADGCITCGDIAVPLTVLTVDGTDAHCGDDTGRSEVVAVELVGPVAPGDRLLVHAGVALARANPVTEG